MRAILTLLALVVILGIVAVATGFVNLSGHAGSLPKVSVQGGQAPSVKADVGSIDVGTSTANVTVPTVGTRQEQVKVPKVHVKTAGE